MQDVHEEAKSIYDDAIRRLKCGSILAYIEAKLERLGYSSHKIASAKTYIGVLMKFDADDLL